MNRRVARAITTLALALTVSCGADDAPTADETPSDTPTTSTTTDPESFDIGGGRHLRLHCEGTGSPTVLFEAGDEDDSLSWSGIQPHVAKETRTCSYDRAGTGSSDPATGCRQLDDIVGDLEALLEVAEVQPPYVLVGASGGGFLIAGFAARHPADVAGMVMLETPKAITFMPPGLKELISCDNPENVEHRDYVAVEHAAWDNRKKLGDFPLRIVSNDYGDAAPEGDEKTNVKDQRGWFVLSSDAKQVVVDSGHDVAQQEADLAIRLIRQVVTASQ